MNSRLTYIDILKTLIAFDTTSYKSNLALIAWAKNLCEEVGAITELVHHESFEKANLLVTFPAADGETKKNGLVFSAHTDVVPVKDQNWDSNPFHMEIKDGKAFGRGTSDMKGFIALILSQAKAISETKLSIPVHFALSYDEEVGCLGVPHLLKRMKKQGIEPRFCVVGEPTEMRIVNGHKGQLFHKCTVKGLESHSSLIDNGVNAIDYAVELITYIQGVAQRARTDGPQDTRFDPPFNSIHVGVIQGGTVNNIIPNHCEFQFEVRYLPGHYPSADIEEIKSYAENELLPRMRERAPKATITFDKLVDFPGLDVSEDCDLVTVSRQLTGANCASTVPFGAEAGHFQTAGIETIICGPGSIEQAHKANEFIALDQLERGQAFIRQMIGHFSAK